MANEDTTEGTGTAGLDAGSYEVVRSRLVGHTSELATRAERLNESRKAIFGSSAFELVQTTRVRTENLASARDMVSVGGYLLFAFNVTLGLKSTPSVSDVFALYKLDGKTEGDALEPVSLEGTFLSQQAFVSDFTTTFRYGKNPRVLRLKRTDTRLLIVIQVGDELRDVKVLRFGIDARGSVTYIDARGEEDNVPPAGFAFSWTRTGREHQVMGPHPHVNVLDEVFVETVNGDLTVKIENNTKDGLGIWREPVADPNQTLDDAEISFARVGALILLKVLPYREEKTRYLVYNTLKKSITRIDAIGRACLALPEDQGILFPGGHYVAADEARIVDPDTEGMRFESTVRAPNGEDALYVFHEDAEGLYLALPYNLITKELGAPVRCHGYSLFEDGTLAVFRSPEGAETTRVHPFQLWRTPFSTLEAAERAGAQRGSSSYLAKVGNPALVRGIGDVYAIRKLVLTEAPTRKTFEELVSLAARALDDHYWLGHEEAFDLKSALRDVRASADAILKEFEKVEAYRARAEKAVIEARAAQRELLGKERPEDSPSAETYLSALSALRTQRGKLVTLRELRYVDLQAIDVLEGEVDTRFAEVRTSCVGYFESETAWGPVLTGLDELAARIAETAKGVELGPHRERLDGLHAQLLLLGETVSGLEVDDPTVRTRVLEQLSKALAVLNRVRAAFEAKRKELVGREGRAELAVQLGVFAQAVGAAVSACSTPEQCDAELGKLMLRLEELSGRFGDLDEFAVEIEKKREEVSETFGSRRQTLSDERHKRAGTLAGAAERMLQGIERKAGTFSEEVDLLAYFASDPMVHKVADSADKLAKMGENVRADELATKLKVVKQDAVRKLRDKRELSDGDGVKLGGFTFSVTKSAIDLVMVPREGGLSLHLTGTDFFSPLDAPELEELRDVWEQSLASESSSVYRAEYLAFVVLEEAISGTGSFDLGKLREAAREGALGALVADVAAKRLDEGYERGVHDADATTILAQLLPAFEAAGPLRFTPTARALALLYAASLAEIELSVLTKRAQSVSRLGARSCATGSSTRSTCRWSATTSPSSSGARRGKRTDLMGLLLLVSPPGYGKTTLMEYVAPPRPRVREGQRPGAGPRGHLARPAEAPNATARQEVEKINLALEMGNNVMLYLDDIQHTNPELLQKFISLCDAQRRIEGVWNGETRTYDLRGKRFCVVMAGNPYTETGEKFRIPDMLANRADTYNLGDVLEGKERGCSPLSYLENALTSNPVLAPLAGRDPKDLDKLVRIAQGEPSPRASSSTPTRRRSWARSRGAQAPVRGAETCCSR
jgi:hypothetical protein